MKQYDNLREARSKIETSIIWKVEDVVRDIAMRYDIEDSSLDFIFYNPAHFR